MELGIGPGQCNPQWPGKGGMARFVALIRALNVGGTGLLAMAELRELCEEIGFKNARTYIQSGNVVFENALPAAKNGQILERALAARLGRAATVQVSWRLAASNGICVSRGFSFITPMAWGAQN